jgi:dsRNA-specific ribonuclease
VTLTKWRPRYADDVLRRGAAPTKPATRELSTKTLADVVEAIIGAAYMSGGLARALRTIAVFLPDLQWQDLRLCRQVLWDTAAPDSALPATLAPVEQLIGYTFKRKSLLVDAMTHASYSSPGATGCLERLEFIGDAILDNLVVAQLFSLAPCLSNVEMHLLRAALVNGDILAFLVMEWCVQTREMHLAPTPGRSTDRSSRHGGPHAARITADALQASDVALPLWSFMRHSAPDLALAQRTTAERHARLRPALLAALGTGPAYPWALLARLQAPKFYSDLFESVLGAVWVDAGEGGGAAAAAACEALLERSGLLPCLRRVVRDGVHVLHPKEEVGRLADRERVRYADEVRLVVDRASGVRAPAFACRLSVGDRVVARVEGGLDKEEARTRAAQEAVRVLKAERAGEEAMDCA